MPSEYADQWIPDPAELTRLREENQSLRARVADLQGEVERLKAGSVSTYPDPELAKLDQTYGVRRTDWP